MDCLDIDAKKLNLLKRSNELLERTKKNYKKYQEERKLLLKLTTDESIDYDIWEKIVTSIEILVNRDENS